MQRSNLSTFLASKFVGASVLAASVAFVPFCIPAIAQTNTAPDTNTSPSQDVDTETDNDFDWGWLGLLGLAGLAGLAGRNKRPDDDIRYRKSDEVRTTHYGR